MQPDFLRIYPTLVLEGTALADSFRNGIYAPLSLDEAVTWLAPAYDLALRAGIPVIRMGLQPDPALEKPGVILAGPYHPAFGCLVRCRWWRDRIDRHFASFSRLLRGRHCFAGLTKSGERRHWTRKVKSPALESTMGHKRKGYRGGRPGGD